MLAKITDDTPPVLRVRVVFTLEWDEPLSWWRTLLVETALLLISLSGCGRSQSPEAD